jgi:hypothetical protein
MPPQDVCELSRPPFHSTALGLSLPTAVFEPATLVRSRTQQRKLQYLDGQSTDYVPCRVALNVRYLHQQHHPIIESDHSFW